VRGENKLKNNTTHKANIWHKNALIPTIWCVFFWNLNDVYLSRKGTPTIIQQPWHQKERKEKKSPQFPHTITLSPILLFLNSIYFQ